MLAGGRETREDTLRARGCRRRSWTRDGRRADVEMMRKACNSIKDEAARVRLERRRRGHKLRSPGGRVQGRKTRVRRPKISNERMGKKHTVTMEGVEECEWESVARYDSNGLG